MKLSSWAGCAAIVCAVLVWSSCGDVFRPVATPVNLQPPGDPAGLRVAITVGTAVGVPAVPVSTSGATSQINGPGDTAMSDVIVGRAPVHATFVGSLQLAGVANSAADDNSISFYTTTAGTTTPATTVTVAPGAQPGFILGVGATMYVANAGRVAVNSVDAPAFTVAVVPVSGVTASTVKLVPLGKCASGSNPPCAPGSALVTNGPPLVLAPTPDGKKIYTANGDGTVSVISTVDNTFQRTITGVMPGACSAPWITANSPGTAIFMVCPEAAQLTVIDPASDTVKGTVGLPGGGNFMTFAAANQRLYVASPAAGAVTALNATTQVPTVLASVPINGLPVPVVSAGVVTEKANSVAVLSDGSGVYAIGSGAGPNCVPGTPQVTVISATSLAVAGCVNVGINPVSLAASTDPTCGSSTGCRVYVAHQGNGVAPTTGVVPAGTVFPPGTTVIRTSDNKVTAEIAAPNINPNCISTAAVPCLTTKPVFVTTSP